MFRYDKQAAYGKADAGFEPIHVFAGRLLGVPEEAVFQEIPCDEDPRGYILVYGNDPEESYIAIHDSFSFEYTCLACYFDYLSFIIQDTLDCTVTPEGPGFRVVIFKPGSDEVISETLVESVSAFYSYIDQCLGDTKWKN